jgi:hypothetical protein
MQTITLTEIAQEIGATEADLRLVADIELDAPHWDGEDTVDEVGRDVLLAHFRGGADR